MTRTLASGDSIADRFSIERVAGEGGMGTVFRARDRLTGAPVALKVVREGQDGRRFLREAEILSGLPHPAIVRYVAHGIEGGLAYLAMEWLEGEDLAQRLSRDGLSIRESVALVAARRRGARRGARARHRPPRRQAEQPVPRRRRRRAREGPRLRRRAARSGAAGHAHRDDRRHARLHGAGAGARRATRIDARADVFSLGCVLFECLTGRPPFVGEHAIALLAKILLEEAPRVGSLRRHVPARLDELVARMLAKDPELRPRDGASVAAELAALATVTARRDPRGNDAAASIAHDRRAARAQRRPRSRRVTRGGAELGVRGDGREHAHAPWLDSVVAIADEHDADVDALADGSLLVTLGGTAAATDAANRAARCALALRRVSAEPIALATGRGSVTGHVAVGDVGRPPRALVDSPSAQRPRRRGDRGPARRALRSSRRRGGPRARPASASTSTRRARCSASRRRASAASASSARCSAIFDECVAEPIARACS